MSLYLPRSLPDRCCNWAKFDPWVFISAMTEKNVARGVRMLRNRNGCALFIVAILLFYDYLKWCSGIRVTLPQSAANWEGTKAISPSDIIFTHHIIFLFAAMDQCEHFKRNGLATKCVTRKPNGAKYRLGNYSTQKWRTENILVSRSK